MIEEGGIMNVFKKLLGYPLLAFGGLFFLLFLAPILMSPTAGRLFTSFLSASALDGVRGPL